MKVRIKSKDIFRLMVITIFTFIFLEYLLNTSDDIYNKFLRFTCELCFIYLLYKGMKEKNILNPYFLFSITPLSILLYSENISKIYLTKLDYYTWIVAIAGIISFIFSLRIFINKSEFIDSKNISESNPEKLKLLRFHSIVLFIISQVGTLFHTFGIPYILSSVTSIFLYPSIACAIKSKSKILTYGIYSYILVSALITNSLTKMTMLSLILVAMCSRYKFNKDDTNKKNYIAIILIFFIFVFIAFPLKSYVRSGNKVTFDGIIESVFNYATQDSNYYTGRIHWDGPMVLEMPYMYLVTAWNNLQYVIKTQPTRTNGLWSFKPLLSWLQLDGKYLRDYDLVPYSSFNTFTFITPLYKDFGMFGVIIESFLLGLFVAKIYNLYKSSQSPIDVACYSLVAQATLEMFFSNHFLMYSYPFTIMIISILYKLFFKSAREI